MIRLYENELTAVYLDLIKKYFDKPYCTSQELLDFKNILMELSKDTDNQVVVFGDQGSSAWFYSDGVNVSVLSTAKEVVATSLVRSYDKLSSLSESGTLNSALLQTFKRELDREEADLHAKKFKYLQLSYEDKTELRK